MTQVQQPKPEDAVGNESREEFEAVTLERPPGFLRECFRFLVEHAAWWLAPIVIVLLLAALLIFGAGSGLPPWIYSVF